MVTITITIIIIRRRRRIVVVISVIYLTCISQCAPKRVFSMAIKLIDCQIFKREKQERKIKKR